MITVKTKEEISIMSQGGKISKNALKLALEMSDLGITLLEIEKEVSKFIEKSGAICSFKTVPGYHHATCINVNSGLVHGIPNNYKLKAGDLIKIDLGTFYKGFHTDTSATKEIATSNETKFIQAGINAVENAAKSCIVGNHLGDVSYEMQKAIEIDGYSVSRTLVGHGIGKNLHEEPLIPPYGKKGTGLLLKEGYVFAIEIIYQKGSPITKILKDNWTIETKDGSLGGLHEHTVAITRDGPLILT